MSIPSELPSPQVRMQLQTVSRPDAVRRARRALETFDELQADEQLAFDASLLVSELVGNAVRHGAADGIEHVELVAQLAEHCLRVEISDSGSGFELGDPGDVPPPDRTSGRGHHLLRTLAHRYGSGGDRAGGHVWFELDL